MITPTIILLEGKYSVKNMFFINTGRKALSYSGYLFAEDWRFTFHGGN